VGWMLGRMPEVGSTQRKGGGMVGSGGAICGLGDERFLLRLRIEVPSSARGLAPGRLCSSLPGTYAASADKRQKFVACR
jgi:hypothetical protein